MTLDKLTAYFEIRTGLTCFEVVKFERLPAFDGEPETHTRFLIIVAHRDTGYRWCITDQGRTDTEIRTAIPPSVLARMQLYHKSRQNPQNP